MADDETEAKALNYSRDYIDIYSNSWGPDDRGFEVKGPGKKTQTTLREGANKVREQFSFFIIFATYYINQYIYDFNMVRQGSPWKPIRRLP